MEASLSRRAGGAGHDATSSSPCDLSALFKGLFLGGLQHAQAQRELDLSHDDTATFRTLVNLLYKTRWHVYAKAPFGDPVHVFRHLGAYTHRVGLANSRLCLVTEDAVTFRTRGANTITLPTMEFMRRFLQHILPRGFVKIRHYGLAASANLQTKHAAAASCLGPLPDLEPEQHSAADSPSPAETDPAQEWVPATLLIALLAAGRMPCPRCAKGMLRYDVDGGPDPP